MNIFKILRAVLARLATGSFIPGAREDLEAHLSTSVDAIDAESRTRAWEQRHRRDGYPF